MPLQEEARALLEEILSRPEFSAAEEGLLSRLVGAINNIIASLFTGSGLIAFALFSLLFLAFFLGLVIFIMRRYRLSLEREAGLPVGAPGQRSPRAALTRSREAAERGKYKEALRYLLLALLLQFDAVGTLDYHRSRTNGEYLRQLRERKPDLFAPLAELVILYENIWYGRADCSRKEYERGLQLYDRLQEAGR